VRIATTPPLRASATARADAARIASLSSPSKTALSRPCWQRLEIEKSSPGPFATALEQWEVEQPHHERELARVEEKLRKGRSSIDRYHRAFETGAMPESVCSDRLKELQAEILTLEASREELLMEQEGAPQAPPQELVELTVSRLEEAIDQGEPQTVKSRLAALIDRVEGSHGIRPIIRVDGVRFVSGQRRRTGIEPRRVAASPPAGEIGLRVRRVRQSSSGGGRESNPPTEDRSAHRF
jgi:hypothetical protein